MALISHSNVTTSLSLPLQVLDIYLKKIIPVPKVSRREFLKYLGAGGIALAIGLTGISSFTPRGRQGKTATAQTNDYWVDGPTTTSHAIHVALLPDGRVLYVAGSGYLAKDKNGPYKAGIWDPSTGDQDEYEFDKDLFCCGLTSLPSGNVLLAGGTKKYASVFPKGWLGIEDAYEFNWQNSTFDPLPKMEHGRWYPTLVVLPDGKVQVLEGLDEVGPSKHNKLNEIYDPEAPDSEKWTITYDPNSSRTYTVGDQTYGDTNMGVNPTLSFYPRMHVMPNGLVALVGMNGARYTWEPGTGRWRGAGAGVNRSYGTSVLLPLDNKTDEKGAILVCGGSQSSVLSQAIATNSAEIIRPNGNSLSATATGDMEYRRRYCNPVILPTGKIMIFGGTEERNDPLWAVMKPEIYDPESKLWSTIEDEHSVRRIYHSGALLLPDGRVWTMGTSYDTAPHAPYPAYELATEIYRPPYYFETRPEITNAPSEVVYGSTFTVDTEDADAVTKISLVRISATTHHYNTDQRLIWLQFTKDSNSQLTVTAPINAQLAPPGYYMLYLLTGHDSDPIGKIPSIAAMIKIKASAEQSVFYNVPLTGTGYVNLKSGGDTRAGIEVRPGSALIGKNLKTFTVYLKRIGSPGPSGDITATVRNKSNDTVPAATFPIALDASTLTGSYQPYTFTLDSTYTLKANDRILIEYAGQNGVQVNVWDTDMFNSGLTRRTKLTSAGNYSYSDTKDLTGTLSSE
jgi:hypothetical protein